MNNDKDINLNSKFHTASKWSLSTEIVAKIMAPITNMILARLLAPEAFGMVATITMVTSFVDIFTQAGFHQYIVQNKFKDSEELDYASDVAFWTNFILSVFFWFIIFIFKKEIALLVGNPRLGSAMAIAALSLPITSFSSIQASRLRRKLDFKALFYTRLIALFVPVFVTIPFAFILKSYWALVVGNLMINVITSVFLIIISKWKPRVRYNFKILKSMISFCGWALCEQILGWANINIGIFIVGAFISEYDLGIYKTSMAMVNQVMAILVNSLSPVLISTLSRMNGSRVEFDKFYYNFLSRIAMIALPIGIGIFIFKDFFTLIILGTQWDDAIEFIGIWGIARSMVVVFCGFGMEVFVSLGKPKFAAYSQFFNLIILVPLLYCTSQIGFREMYIMSAIACIWTIFVDQILLKIAAQIKLTKIWRQTGSFLVDSMIMGIFAYGIRNVAMDSISWTLISISLCILLYFLLICIVPKTRVTFMSFLSDYVIKENRKEV